MRSVNRRQTKRKITVPSRSPRTEKRGAAVGVRVGARAGVDLERSLAKGGDLETGKVKRARRAGVAGGVDPGTGAIQIEGAGTAVVEEGAGVEEENEADPAPFTGDLPTSQVMRREGTMLKYHLRSEIKELFSVCSSIHVSEQKISRNSFLKWARCGMYELSRIETVGDARVLRT